MSQLSQKCYPVHWFKHFRVYYKCPTVLLVQPTKHVCVGVEDKFMQYINQT